MISLWSWGKLVIAVGGNLAVWLAVFNQIHATRWPRWARKLFEKLIYAVLTALTIILIANAMGWMFVNPPVGNLVAAWSWFCMAAMLIVLVRWLFLRWTTSSPEEVVAERRQLVNLGEGLTEPGYAGLQARLLGMVPGNQSLKLSVEHRVLELERWPAELDGLVIAHLSDLHFTGKISREYFERVVQYCNECSPDMICLTGDIIDAEKCLDWFPVTLGRLQARFGKYYVLGNHDLRIKDESRLRGAIEAEGFVRAAGSWLQVDIRQTQLYLSGNELPWYFGADQLSEPPPGTGLVIAHSPDQIFWAENLDASLMLAGHCHGGQIRLPLIGPLVAPSRYGIRFASGTFKVGRTLMHVSKGISGDDPIRWNCPPELGIIKINARSRSGING